MTQTLELARFTVKPEAEATIIATRRRAINALRLECDGFVSGTFVRIGASEWLDVIVWADGETAESAAAKAPTILGCADYFCAVSALVSMEHGQILDTD
jgi:hypothetical protein